MGGLEAKKPGLVAQWLLYNIWAGIDHFTIVDTDGSFAAILQPFIDKGYVTYVPAWPSRQFKSGCAAALDRSSREDPARSGWRMALGMQASNACTFAARGGAHWVANVEIVDEFL